ncbi:MAG: ACT domain-containing protein [Candidatus Omnitrophica bacterium]|nr:ACT domain-containing protein [Candidatus Omnitrophota bacterium]
MTDDLTRCVISVLAPDSIGIIKRITSAITDLGGDIDGMSQTVIHGYFTVILTAEFQTVYTKEQIRDAILNNFEPGDASVMIRHFEEIPPPSQIRKTDRYILTLTGKDRPGILKTVTSYLADNNINIEDYFFTIQGDHVTHIGEVSVPSEIDIKQLQGELQTLVSSIDLVATLQHEFLFRAANDIFSIRQLFKMKK